MERTLRWTAVGFVLGALVLSACAGARPGPRTLPHWIELRVEVADPYPVLVGPIETYQYLPVGADLRASLEQWAGAVNPPAGARLTVTVQDLSAGYDEVGAGPPAEPLRLASLRLADLELDGADLSIPEEIRKSLQLVAGIRFSAPGGPPLERTETIEATRVVRWEEYDRWAYDYRPVWGQALRDLVTRLDRMAEEAGWARAKAR
ncbi:hypothetical protein [Deferrisoma palaeochoriense]